MRHLVFLLAAVAMPAAADPALKAIKASEAQVVILGETHDNPHHHARQAEIVAALDPSALVFEFLTFEQAWRHLPGAAEPDLKTALGWDERAARPDFSMYYPIFAAAPDAAVLGALVPRDRARDAMRRGTLEVFSGFGPRFDLDQPLPESELAQRLALQAKSHCDALPPEMLPMMVEVQRLRDAELARAALAGLDAYGGPVVVITGNGHARRDWGVPAMIALARPEAQVFSLGQAETDTALDGGFDLVVSAPAVERDDPCAAVR
ncbi:MAG: hypothetical protein GVY31_06610 [Alphaproteobacteria bacterium]|jgi:uncharacterized iron-regulated protein|nr:hypothetical protein [Alphaproteobacteria bacterium]